MYHNFTFGDINEALPALLSSMEDFHAEVGTRQGSRVQELTHVGVTLTAPRDRYIMIPGRKANLAAQIAETMWVLSGRNDIEWLSHYLPRAADFSDDGVTWRGGYGPRLRSWGEGKVDQIKFLLDLLREDPITRRAAAVIWDPAQDSLNGKDNRAIKDLPCNNWLHFMSRLGELDLHVATRSNDIWWGWSGVNVFEWSALQEILAGMLGVESGSLHFSISSLHLYDQHWARAHKLVENASETPALLKWASRQAGTYNVPPRFDASTISHDLDQLDWLLGHWMRAEEYVRTNSPRAERIVADFPEPMLKSWLRVIQWWWSGNLAYLEEYVDTDLYAAARVAVQPPERRTALVEIKNWDGKPVASLTEGSTEVQKMAAELAHLHAEKHAAYGDSWKRRGESMGIMANIARKVDRLLMGTATSDENLQDTASDLLIYAIKYRLWLTDAGHPPFRGMSDATSEEPERVAQMLSLVLGRIDALQGWAKRALVNNASRTTPKMIDQILEHLSVAVAQEAPDRHKWVDQLIRQSAAYLLMNTVWHDYTTRAWKGYGE